MSVKKAAIASSRRTVAIYPFLPVRPPRSSRADLLRPERSDRIDPCCATRGVLIHLMRDGARLGLIGLVFGLAGGMALARTMAGVLLGLSPADPITFTRVPLALTIVIVVATFVPARRAARLDAVAALRTE